MCRGPWSVVTSKVDWVPEALHSSPDSGRDCPGPVGDAMKTRMRDADVRPVLMAALLQRHEHEPDTRIIPELGLLRGERRVDVAVVNGELHGYEIKSEADDLSRLVAQSEVYGTVLDKVTLVAAERHLIAARVLVPVWWGLVAVSSCDDQVAMTEVRQATESPVRQSAALCQLLWRDELRLLLEPRFGDGINSFPRRELLEIAGQLPIEELAPVVRAALKARQGWRAT